MDLFDTFYKKIVRFLLVLMYFVSPLIFFTNLTRNPYFIQIAIINISMAIWLSLFSIKILKSNHLRIRVTPIHYLFILMILIFFITSLQGYILHSDFFKPAIINENKRIWFYTFFNAFLPFVFISQLERGKNIELPYNPSFIVGWGVSWLFFKMLKSNHPFIDLYGACLWLWALFYLYSKTQDEQISVLNLAIVSGFYASIYGILQYFGLEIIWDKTLMPYGRRAITTFGNPNFASSYMLMLIPFVIFFYTRSKGFSKKFYFLTFIALIAMIFSSLTRSTIIGLFFSALALVYLSYKIREISSHEFKKIIFSFLIVLILWPDQNLSFGGGIIKRFSEALSKTKSNMTMMFSREDIYQSFHQRLLIWRCGLDMFLENPAFGKGWGNFELFYPFYQGYYLRINQAIRELRTHANNAHNEIIEILSQTGIIGFGFCLLFLVSIIIHSIKNYQIRKDLFIVLSLISILSMLIDNLLNVSIHFAVPGLLFFTCMGVLVSSFSIERMITINKTKIFSILLFFISILYIYQWIKYLGREIYYFSGFKEMRKNNFHSAKIHLQKAYSFHKWEVNNTYELANAYVKNGELEKAVSTYYNALKSNAGYDEIYFNLAIVERNLLRLESAKNNLRTSLWINPTNEKAYYAYAEIVLLDINKIKEDDIIIIEDGLRNHKNNSYMNWIVGYIYEKMNEIEKSKKYYETALILDPTNRAYVSYFEKITKSSHVFDFLEVYTTVINSNKYDKEKVAKKIKKFEELYGDYISFIFLKAKYLFDIGEYDKSEELLLRILKIEPSFYKSLEILGNIYELKGDIKTAISYYEKYLNFDKKNQEILLKTEKLKRMK